MRERLRWRKVLSAATVVERCPNGDGGKPVATGQLDRPARPWMYRRAISAHGI